jgi:pyruvate kinase
MRKTKIVCTLGPTSSTPEMIEALINAGMNTARLNFSHGDHETHRRVYATVREISTRMGQPVAVLQDLQGPKIRVGKLPGGSIELSPDSEVAIVHAESSDDGALIPCSYPHIAKDVVAKDRILLDDGRLRLEVIDAKDGKVRCAVKVGGELSDKKGINLPGVNLSTPAVTEKDRQDIVLGKELGVDYVALSFVRSADDVKLARSLIAAGTPLLAKIEKPEALDCIEEIIELTDGIMVARGDLGVEMGPERVPLLQKELIEKANQRCKLVITATEMLDSMRFMPRPTRAEASDVANAVLDGSDAVMLSGETAKGEYPVRSVETMGHIINEIERSARFRLQPSVASLQIKETTTPWLTPVS